MTRVFFNGRFLVRPVTGVERFGGEIIRAVDTLCTEGHSAVDGLDFEIVRPPADSVSERFSRIPERVIGRRGGHLWEQFDLPRYVRGGVLVNLCNLAPLHGALNVTCVHDANVFLIPQSFAWPFRVAYRIMLPLVIRRSSRWITVSDYSARQLVRLGVADRPPNAIVGNGSEHIRRLQPSRSRLATIELPPSFIFAMGSKSRNKNIDLLLGLSGALHEMGLSVVLAGGANPRVFNRPAATPHPNVLELGRIDDDDIAFLCTRALCFAFPSFYEGFGIPAIEAMACGCPVIAADSSALPEVLGDAALLCPPTDPQAWLSAIANLAKDSDLRAWLVQRGRERAAAYSWRQAALRLLDVIGTLAAPDVPQAGHETLIRT
jgi:glycosyltransferase involved in cell wall biosynthesis